MKMLKLLMVCCLLVSISGAVYSDFNVKDFGAVGDGKADDTAAFRKAIDEASIVRRGASVLVPAGEYRITETLKLESVLLKGLEVGGWSADNGPMPVLRVDFTDGPCITAGSGASIHGLRFEHDHRDEMARKFGPTIQLSGIGISITNVMIHQPYEGIMADGESNIGRLNIENVFIVSARRCGVYVTNTLDIPTLRNVEVWNPLPYCIENSIGFKLGRNDEIRLDNCFAFQCRIGFHFIEDSKGVTWGGMSNCTADACVEGVVVENAETVRVTGGSFWCHATAVRVAGPGRVMVTGADLRANGDSVLVVKDCTSLTVTGCSLGKAADQWPTVPAARIEGGRSVLINGCTFDAYGPGIVIGESADNFSITGNVFQPSPFEAIKDKSPTGANKIIANNLMKKAEAVDDRTDRTEQH